MNYADLIVEMPNALPDDFCDHLIKKFEEDEVNRYKGLTGGGINLDMKDSTDLSVSHAQGWEEEDSKIFDLLTPKTAEYMSFYTKKISSKGYYHGDLGDSGYQIQRTDENGRYDWHNDFCIFPILDTIANKIEDESKIIGANSCFGDMLITTRLFTFIYYLNDASEFEGGRTQFYLDGEYYSITPEKGKLLWFPSEKQYMHRGERVRSGHKYIMTGWIHEETINEFKGTTEGSRKFRDFLGEENMTFPFHDQIWYNK